MAFAVTLGELVTRAQQLGNQPGGEQLDPTEWKAHISSAYGRVHSTVADTCARLFETEATLNLASLALPASHRSTIGVDFVDASGRRRELAEFMIHERNVFSGETGEARVWWLSGTSIVLAPVPSTGTYKHLYVAQPTRYHASADSTSIDVLTSDGYDAIVWGAASIGLHRSESDQRRAAAEFDGALARLKEWAVIRSLSMPRRRQVTEIDLCRGGMWNPAGWWNR